MRSLILLFSLLVALPALAAPPPSPPDFTVDAAGRKQLVDDMLRALDQNFVFPDRLAQQRAELVRRWSTPQFNRLTSAKALAHAMDDDMAALFHDKHLGVRLRRPGGPAPHAGELTAAEMAEMEKQSARDHFGIVRAEVLDDNIGYLKIDGFPPAEFAGTQQAWIAAMSFVGDTDGLILDLRDNHGGDGETVALLMGYLLDSKKLLLNEYFRPTNQSHEHWSSDKVPGRRYGEKRPLWVLTSSETFSAGEELAYDVQTLKRGTLVGETTGGGANHNMFLPLGGGRFVTSIPFGTTRSPVTGTNWEGVGVKPELPAERGKALEVALAAARRRLGVTAPVGSAQK